MELAAARVDEGHILDSYERRGLAGLFALLGEDNRESVAMFRRMAKVCGIDSLAVNAMAATIGRMV